MIVVVDVGNTVSCVGLADGERVVRFRRFRTCGWEGVVLGRGLGLRGGGGVVGVVVGSVVPGVTGLVEGKAVSEFGVECVRLSYRNVVGVGIDYPRPGTIGADRLANVMAGVRGFGFPLAVVDFGTALTIDVVDGRGFYVGGVIAPGLGVVTDYLHERTALLPRVRIRGSPVNVVGRSTREAMWIGGVRGLRGLVSHLLGEVREDLGRRDLRVVATGGYAGLMSEELGDVCAVVPELTLEGLRLLGVDYFGVS